MTSRITDMTLINLKTEKRCLNIDISCGYRNVIFKENGEVLFTICPYIGFNGCNKLEEVKPNDPGCIQHSYGIISI